MSIDCEGTGHSKYNGGWIICQKCNHTGNGTKEKVEKAWLKQLPKWQAAENLFNERMKRLDEILKTLNDNDLDILAEHYFTCCECGPSHARD